MIINHVLNFWTSILGPYDTKHISNLNVERDIHGTILWRSLGRKLELKSLWGIAP